MLIMIIIFNEETKKHCDDVENCNKDSRIT